MDADGQRSDQRMDVEATVEDTRQATRRNASSEPVMTERAKTAASRSQCTRPRVSLSSSYVYVDNAASK